MTKTFNILILFLLRSILCAFPQTSQIFSLNGELSYLSISKNEEQINFISEGLYLPFTINKEFSFGMKLTTAQPLSNNYYLSGAPFYIEFNGGKNFQLIDDFNHMLRLKALFSIQALHLEYNKKVSNSFDTVYDTKTITWSPTIELNYIYLQNDKPIFYTYISTSYSLWNHIVDQDKIFHFNFGIGIWKFYKDFEKK